MGFKVFVNERANSIINQSDCIHCIQQICEGLFSIT